MKMSLFNSFDQDTYSIPQRNHYFRDSSTNSSDSDELSTTPTTPTSPTTPNTDTLNSNPPNLQRRASESLTESIQFKKSPASRRYTLPSRFGLVIGSSESNRGPLSKFWESGRDSSVQVAMVSWFAN